LLLLLPASVYVVFQQVNPEKSAQTQQSAVQIGCDQIDIPVSLKVSDTASLVGYCFVSGQSNVSKVRFTLTTPDGVLSPKEYLAFAAAEKNKEGKRYFKATYPNIKFSKAGSYKVEITGFTAQGAASSPFTRNFAVGTSTAAPNLAPTSSPTPVATGAAAANKAPTCSSLSAIPLTGPSPLTVSFTGTGADSDGQVVSFEFTFGDKAKQTVSKNVSSSGSATTSHAYQTAGAYTATLRVQDNSGSMSAATALCSVQISATAGAGGSATASGALKAQPTNTASPTPTPVTLPQAGISLPMVGFVSAGLLLLTLGLLLAL